METLRPFLDQALTIWKDSTAAARVGIILLTILCGITIVGVGIWSATPEYVELPRVTDHDQRQALINELETKGLDYRLKGEIIEINKRHKNEVPTAAYNAGLRDGAWQPNAIGSWLDPRTRDEHLRYNKEQQIAYQVQQLKFVSKAIVISRSTARRSLLA